MDSRFLLPATVAAAVHGLILFGIGPATPAPVRTDPPDERTFIRAIPDEPFPLPPEPSDEVGDKPRGTVSSRPTGDEVTRDPNPGDFTIATPPRPPPSDHAVPVIEPGIVGVPNGNPDAISWGNREVVRSGDLDRAPRTRVQVRPVYPAAARSSGRGAEVTVEFMVDELGRVENVRVVRTTDAEFDAATLQAVAKWRFEPGKKNGVPVRFRMVVPVVFSLSE